MRASRAAMLTTGLIAWDGRVQKVARSIAGAGWSVTLIGRSASGRVERGRLGRARVVGLPARSRTGDWRSCHLIDLDGVDRVLDEVRPDLIHAHDVDTLGLAARARRNARGAGRSPAILYDAHEYVAGVDRPDPTWRLAMLVEEQRYIAEADGVVTVSEPLARLLFDRYRLPVLPSVVLNAPERRLSAFRPERTTLDADVRGDCGLASTTSLLLYSGAVAPARGLATVVEGLRHLPGVHLALQVAARHQYVAGLEAQAAGLGVRDRLHVLPYVDVRHLVDYIRSADAGVIPLLHAQNHEVALCNKYFECMHAGLPMVVSDVKLQAESVRRLGIGEVFTAGDVASFTAATRAVLADRERYVRTYDQPGLLDCYSWEAQIPTLLDSYARAALG